MPSTKPFVAPEALAAIDQAAGGNTSPVRWQATCWPFAVQTPNNRRGLRRVQNQLGWSC